MDLYEEWGQPEKQAPYLAELKEIMGRKITPRKLKPTPVMGKPAQLFAPSTPKPPKPEKLQKLGRNDPCWCGSGKKYKRCHMKSDKR